jgi:hypothetical protein
VRIFLDATPEEAFRLITNYFVVRRVKALASDEASYIKAEIGSWFSFADEGNAKGEVEAKLTKGNTGSYVNFDFDFTKEYAFGSAAAICGALSCYVIGSWLVHGLKISKSLGSAELWVPVLNLMVALLSMASFVSIMALEGCTISRTKQRFMEELDIFIQPLASKNQTHTTNDRLV